MDKPIPAGFQLILRPAHDNRNLSERPHGFNVDTPLGQEFSGDRKPAPAGKPIALENENSDVTE